MINWIKNILNKQDKENDTPDKENIILKEKENKKKIKNNLRIYFPNGGYINYSVKSEDGESRVLPWKYFYKWFFSRKQSQYYMFKHGDGERLIDREKIDYFEIIIC